MAEITLRDFGSFTVGGRAVGKHGLARRKISLSAGLNDVDFDPNGNFWIEQAYVQYFIPARQTAKLPLVLIHGGGLTGSCWETTPDGRPGWLNDFLVRGFPVYVVDNVERGRSGFCAVPSEWPDQPIMRSAEESWELFRIGPPDGFDTKHAFGGQKFPVDCLDELSRKSVPRWLSTAAIQQAALLSAVERIGQCVLLGHSQGGGFAIDLAASRPELVQAVIALEAHGGFAAVGTQPLQGRKMLIPLGDYMDCNMLWIGLEERLRTVSDKWTAAGGDSIIVRLSEIGFAGHSHLMMMDNGSENISSWLAQWILDTI